MSDSPDNHSKRRKRRRRRKAVTEAELGVFLRKYARKAPKRGEPNDRGYCRKIEQRIKQMRPEDVDQLMNGDDAEHD